MKKIQKIKSIFESFSKSCEEHILYQGKDDKTIICSHLKNSNQTEAIVIFGGDGTASKVINWLLEENISIPIGIIPSGTCNDFSGVLYRGETLEEQIGTIVNGETIPVDLGVYQKDGARRYFICCYEVGKLSYVSYGTPERFKKHFKTLAYYFVLLRQLIRLRDFHVKIQTEDHRFEGKVLGVLILNGHKFAGFRGVSRDADISDGKMNLILVTGKKRKVLGVLIKLFTGRADSCPELKQYDFERIEIETNDIIETMIDGEKGDDLPIRIDVIKGAIQVLAKKPKQGVTTKGKCFSKTVYLFYCCSYIKM